MRSRKLFVTAALILAVFALGLPSTTPRVYGLATPCLTAHPCGIAILSPGPGATINKNADVNPSFIVSFLVHNITIVNPGTTGDVNTTIGSGTSGHNEGHIHVFVDNVYTTIWANLNGIPLTLTPGSHTIRLDLVNDLHQEFSPGINASTTVNVVDPLQSNASNAMYFSLGALIVSIIAVILVAYVAFKRKPKA